MNSSNPTVVDRPVRIWPVMVIGCMAIVTLFVPTLLSRPDFERFGALALGAALETLLMLLWLLLLSRLPWTQKLVSLFAAAGIATMAFFLQHRDLGVSIFLYGFPLGFVAIAVVLWLARTKTWSEKRWLLLGAWSIFTLGWLLFRSDGFKASFFPEIYWRWLPNSEERLARNEPTPNDGAEPSETPPVQLRPGDWPRFRGAQSDGQAGHLDVSLDAPIHIKTLWKIDAGPSWGSIIAVGGWIYTLEQRNEDEAIVCLNADNGEARWIYRYKNRFEDPTKVSGVGPRGTPIFSDGHIFTVGADGHVCAVAANTGKLIWQKQLFDITKGKSPQWGLSTSPWLSGNDCIIMSSGSSESAIQLVNLHARDGSLQWSAEGGGETYSSPVRTNLGGVDQILSVYNRMGGEQLGHVLISRNAQSGEELWRYGTNAAGNVMAMPLVIDNQHVVFCDPNAGATLLRVTSPQTPESKSWTIEKKWQQSIFLSEFSDPAVQDGMLLGICKGLLTAIDLETGKRLWKKFRFGGGQMISLADQKAVLAISEEGKLSLIRIEREGPQLLQQWQAIEGKTWNHPIIVGNRVYCRNYEQIACFELSN